MSSRLSVWCLPIVEIVKTNETTYLPACIYTIIEDNGKSIDDPPGVDPPGVSRLLSIFEKLWLNSTTIENFYADLKRAKDSLNAYFTGGP